MILFLFENKLCTCVEGRLQIHRKGSRKHIPNFKTDRLWEVRWQRLESSRGVFSLYLLAAFHFCVEFKKKKKNSFYWSIIGL